MIIDLLRQYQSELGDRASQRTYKSAITTCITYFHDEERDELEINDLTKLRTWLDERYSKSTRRLYITAFKKFLGWASLHDHISGEMYSKILLHYEQEGRGGEYTGLSRRQIDHEDIEKILDAFKQGQEAPEVESANDKIARLAYMRDRAMVYLLAGTGLRITELLSLKRPIFDTFFANWDGKQSMVIPVVGKRQKPRNVVATAKYLLPMKEYLSQRGEDPPGMRLHLQKLDFESPAFIPHNGRHAKNYSITRQSAWRSLAKTARLLGIDSFVGPHAFRHFCLDRLAGSASLRTVSDLAGHEDIRVTQQFYLSQSGAQELVRAVEDAEDE